MGYPQKYFFDDVFNSIKSKKRAAPTAEECKAVAHHMEYNVRADRRYANNGHLRISIDDLRARIVSQIQDNLHDNDIPRYVEQYRRYKAYQQNWQLTPQEEKDLQAIAKNEKKTSDFTDKDYLKNVYIKYFNQRVMPEIRRISWQEKNHLKYHGLWHTEQVALFAIDIAVEDNINPLPCLLAAALHDCARKNDRSDPDHAKNCEPIARNFLYNTYQDRNLLTSQDKQQIIHAATHHNVPTRDKSNAVLNCLQDADSMRLWWERGQTYGANTPTGQKLATYKDHRWQQIKYLANMLERMRSTTPRNSRYQNILQNSGNTFTK